jgi:hypothetical protein
VAPVKLHLAPCSYEAAKFACLNFHYAKTIPRGKLVRIGVWEDGVFIGVVIFGRGASSKLCQAYQLDATELAELVRVALREHKTEVTRIVSIAISLLKKSSPGLKLLVSYADPHQGHVGGIYQGGNWLYSGKTNTTKIYIDHDGSEHHSRVVSAKGYNIQFGGVKKVRKPDSFASVETRPGKHRYLMGLTKDMRKKIAHLSKDYPKQECERSR